MLLFLASCSSLVEMSEIAAWVVRFIPYTEKHGFCPVSFDMGEMFSPMGVMVETKFVDNFSENN